METEIWTQSALSRTRQKTWLPPTCTNELLVGSNGKAKWWGKDPMCRCWESQAFGKCHEVMPWVVLSEADKTLTWVFSLSASLCHIFWGRGPPVYPHPATCLAWQGHRKAAHSFPLFFLPFSPFSFPSPEVTDQRDQSRGVFLCRALWQPPRFAWLSVFQRALLLFLGGILYRPRETRRGRLCCLRRNLRVAFALFPLATQVISGRSSYTEYSLSAFKCGCKWLFQGHAVAQGWNKEITEDSWYVFHDRARKKSPHLLRKGKRGEISLYT